MGGRVSAMGCQQTQSAAHDRMGSRIVGDDSNASREQAEGIRRLKWPAPDAIARASWLSAASDGGADTQRIDCLVARGSASPSPVAVDQRFEVDGQSETEALDQPRQADPPGPPPRGSQGADDAGFQGLGPSAHTRTRWPALVWTAGRLDGGLGDASGPGQGPTHGDHPSIPPLRRPTVRRLDWIHGWDTSHQCR